MKNHKSRKTIIAAVCISLGIASFLKADEMNDLIGEVLQSSPSARAKVAKYPSVHKGKSTPIPNIGIPDSEVMEASSKFPNDFVGKYIYGTLIFKGMDEVEGEPSIMFDATNRRGFTLFTKDPAVIAKFKDMPWGTKFSVPRECPLRIISKGMFVYMLRMPFDKDTENHM